MTVYHTVFYQKKNQWLFIYSWSRSWYPIDCQYNAWFVSEGVNILFAQRLLSMAFPSNGIHVLWYKSIPLLLKNYRLYHLYRSWLSFTAFLKEKKTFHVFHFICLNSISDSKCDAYIIMLSVNSSSLRTRP